MPEGPEVKCIADSINLNVGQSIIKAEYSTNKKHKWFKKGIPGWELLDSNLPLEIQKINVKGKLIKIDFDKEISLLSTLGMEGNWVSDTPENSTTKILKYKRVWFTLNNHHILSYNDSRNFGTIRILNQKEATKIIDKIGWDLLRSPMPFKDWRNLQVLESIKTKEIGQVLMDQKKFSGIGNIYKAEVLYAVGLNPTTLVEDIDQNTWDRINLTAHRILNHAYDIKGSSVATYHGGSFQNFINVYRKTQCPIGHEISSIEQNKRTTWYCDICQS